MEAVYKEFANMCQTGSLEQLQEMIREYPDIEKDLHEGLAFSFAAFGGNLDVVKYLFKECPENTQKKGARALCFAAGRGHLDVVRFLVETCHMDVNVDRGLPLCNASGYGDLGVVKYLIEKCGVAVCDEPLLYAANKHHKGVVKYLLNQGASFSDFQSIEPPKSEAYRLKAKDFCQKMMKEIKLEKVKEAEKLFQHNLKMLKKAKNIKKPMRRRSEKNFKNGKI